MREFKQLGVIIHSPKKSRSRVSIFREKVFAVVRRIPKGTVLTYKEVARLAGNTLAVRAVGNILTTNYDPQIPCHRVIKSDGTIGGYNRGQKQKRARLKEEGFAIK